MKRKFRGKQQGFAIILVTIMLMLFMSILASTSMRKVLFATRLRDDLQDVYLAADNCADSLSQYLRVQTYREHFGGSSNLYVLDETDGQMSLIARNEEAITNAADISNYCLPGIWANFAAAEGRPVAGGDVSSIFSYGFANVGPKGNGADIELSYFNIKIPDNCIPSTDASMLGGGAGAASYSYYWTLAICEMPYVNRRNGLDAVTGITPAFQKRKFALITLPD